MDIFVNGDFCLLGQHSSVNVTSPVWYDLQFSDYQKTPEVDSDLDIKFPLRVICLHFVLLLLYFLQRPSCLPRRTYTKRTSYYFREQVYHVSQICPLSTRY